MSISQTIFELARKHPQRQPGSSGLNHTFNGLKEIVADWGVNTELQKIQVYSFKTSLLVFVAGSIVSILLSLASPGWGLVVAIILLGLFLGEMVRPLLAKIKPTSGNNYIVNIPARSKENQKLILTAAVSTDSFHDQAPKMSPQLYLLLALGLGSLIPICLLLNWGFQMPLFLYLAPAPIVGLIFLILSSRKTPAVDPNLNKASILLELGAVLLKSRPLSTSVILFLTGSTSLNSGVLPIPKYLEDTRPKSGAPLTYVVNITDLPDKRINVVTADGFIVSRPGEPLLSDLLMEISREKKIPTQEIKLKQFTEAYPLKFRKIMTISLTHPQEHYMGANANKDLRELLLGLIRKLD